LRSRLTPPPLPVPHIPRPRLWELLDAASNRALTIVRGPAGSGKTALLASWYLARRDVLPLVWLQVDPATDPVPAGAGDDAEASFPAVGPASASGTPVARVSFWGHLLVALRAHPEADPTARWLG
jgi:LuxR family maltose regulon positive regulatory protein